MRIASTGILRHIAIGALALAACVSPATAQEKVLRIPNTTSGPGTLDPVRGSTTYENRAASCVYETLLEYKYLVRPLELQPLLLAEMPEVSDGGRLWRFKLKQGVLFHDDECFPNGTGRELVASDVFYSWRRLADPKYQFKSWWLVDGLIEGFNEYRDEQREIVSSGGEFDYDAPVSGFRIINDHEFEVELTRPNQQFIWRLAMFQLSIVPKEAVDYYNSGSVERFNAHPVGTGPFIMKDDRDWNRGVSIRFERNPKYREAYYPDEWMPEDEEFGLQLPAGKRIPFVDAVEFHYYVESQPMWLEFKDGIRDFTTVPQTAFEEAFSSRTKQLRRSWSRTGKRAVFVPLLDFIFRAFNMEDELLGGYTDDKRALRQAFNLAMDWDEMNETFYFGIAIPYDGPIPPGLDGHPNNEDHRAPYSTRGQNLERAREKLREAGYTIGPDGKVTDLPVIQLYTSAGAESQRIVELMLRNLAEVGIQVNPRYQNFSDLMQTVDNRKAPLFSFAWGSDYPDAENNLRCSTAPTPRPARITPTTTTPSTTGSTRRSRPCPPAPSARRSTSRCAT